MLLLYNNNAFIKQNDSFYFAIAKHLFIKHLAIASQIIFTLNAIYKKIKKKRRQIQLSTLSTFTLY